MRLPPEAIEALRRTETVDVALQQNIRQGPMLRALQRGSYGGDPVAMNGYYDESTEEWTGYMEYNVDAYNSGKGMAP